MSDAIRKPFSILIVEDQDDTAESMVELLSLSGLNPRTAYNSLDAVRAVETLLPDVILLDIGLPGMNGWELAGQLRAISMSPILIAITGFGTTNDRQRSKDAGINLHLVKPVEPAALISLMKQISRDGLKPTMNN